MMLGNRIALFLYYGMRGLVALAFALFLVFANWADAFYTALIFLLMIAPSVLKNRYKFYLPFGIEVAIVGFVFLTLFLGGIRDYYNLIPVWDEILHFQSGLLLGVVGFVLVYVLNEEKRTKLDLSPGFIAFFAVTFSLAIANLWEIGEYLADTFLGWQSQGVGITDTMTDLIVNAVGASIVGVIGYIWMKNSHKLPFTPRVLHTFQYGPKHAIQNEEL